MTQIITMDGRPFQEITASDGSVSYGPVNEEAIELCESLLRALKSGLVVDVAVAMLYHNGDPGISFTTGHPSLLGAITQLQFQMCRNSYAVESPQFCG